MGAEQSSAGSASPNLSAYLNQKAREGAVRRKHSIQRCDSKGIVTVSTGLPDECDDPVKDADYIRLSHIPAFYPIFKNALNIPGVKDAPDLYSKFDHRPITGLTQRLQDHLAAACQLASIEQTCIISRIREVDIVIASLANTLTDRQKRFARISQEICKVRELSSALKKIDAQLPEVVASLQSLNDFLPDDLRLDPLDLSSFSSKDSPVVSMETLEPKPPSLSSSATITNNSECDDGAGTTVSLLSNTGGRLPHSSSNGIAHALGHTALLEQRVVDLKIENIPRTQHAAGHAAESDVLLNEAK